MLIIEIALTIWAWRKGWKSKSLLPMGIIMGLGFIVGLFIGGLNIDINSLNAWFILADLGAIITLIYMIANPPVVKKVIEKETFKIE